MISVVTVCKNDLNGLRRTVDSLRTQTFRDFEHIVIDSASTDGTVEYLRSISPGVMTWTSESDGGISEGFNKGIARSRGDWILFLNAGDALMQVNTFAELAPVIAAAYADGVGFVTGYEADPAHAFRYPTGTKVDSMHLYEKARMAHQATFVRRDLFARYGLFSDCFRITMDYEFHIRALKSEKLVFVDKDICLYDIHGISTTAYFRAAAETVRAQLLHVRGIKDLAMIVFFAVKWFSEKFALGRNMHAQLRSGSHGH